MSCVWPVEFNAYAGLVLGGGHIEAAQGGLSYHDVSEACVLRG